MKLKQFTIPKDRREFDILMTKGSQIISLNDGYSNKRMVYIEGDSTIKSYRSFVLVRIDEGLPPYQSVFIGKYDIRSEEWQYIYLFEVFKPKDPYS